MLEECVVEKIEVLRREDSHRQSYVDIVPDLTATSGESQEEERAVTPASDLSLPHRRVWVVTTASLPWMTGTAVNPLMRALFLTRHSHHVTLLIPWVEDPQAREILFGQTSFENPKEQAAWIREWCNKGSYGKEAENLGIQFWKGVYHHSLGSIFPVEDICALIPADQADVAILEEPEHLNWFRVASDESCYYGWAEKFKHVVGILHTNYGSYMKQYGMGSSLLTAPALNALSTLVCKAYCHRLVRLSDTLTSLCPGMEVTSNVHGVRAEFFQKSSDPDPPSGVGGAVAAVYFVGKLIWAKGFESVLRLQDRYRNQSGEYFAMDVYGTGNDSKAIQRAFFGRKYAVRRQGSDDSASSGDADFLGKDDQAAAEIFDRDESLRCMLRERTQDEDTSAVDNSEVEVEAEDFASKATCAKPLDVITDLSKRTLGTGVETAGAAFQLVESALTQGFGTFKDDKEDKSESSTAEKKKKKPSRHPFRLGPSLAVYKWRKTPIPARFMGRKDHLEMKDCPTNIFLNMSTSEVLCTTSAEALAMGKFVILPKHPSNTFFLQFNNCLAYENLDECVEKLQYALSHQPKPLSEEEAHKLSWEGAIERLYESSGIPKGQECEPDLSAARFHVETSRKSQYVSKLFNGTLLRG